MNHPRYSVLNLFDPLMTVMTPTKDCDSERTVTTPDSASGSDKENAAPSYAIPIDCGHDDTDKLTMTTFFNRTYKRDPKYYPVRPRKRLIDVGDATLTIDDASEMLAALTVSDGATSVEEGNLPSTIGTVNCSPQIQARNAQKQTTEQAQTAMQSTSATLTRTPLADISLDATPVPYKHRKPASNKSPSDPSLLSTVLRAPLSSGSVPSTAPPILSVLNIEEANWGDKEENNLMTPLASHKAGFVIVVSDPSETDQMCQSDSYPLLTEARLPDAILPPSIMNEDYTESALSGVQDSASLFAGPRPRPRTRASPTLGVPTVNSNRTSIDLQSSFNWQLQCPEASFDLLNDRISFFGGDSFVLGADADEFDAKLKEEMKEAFARRQRDKAVRGHKPNGSSGDVKLDLKPADYEPASPIVTYESCQTSHLSDVPQLPTAGNLEELPLTSESPALTTESKLQLSPPPDSASSVPSLLVSDSETTSPSLVRPKHGYFKVKPTHSGRLLSQTLVQPMYKHATHSQANEAVCASRTVPSTPLNASDRNGPAPVRANRIIKRAKMQKQSQHRPASVLSVASSSSGSTSSTSYLPPGNAEERPPSSEPDPKPRAQSIPRRPDFSGILRPPPGYSVALTQRPQSGAAGSNKNVKAQISVLKAPKPVSGPSIVPSSSKFRTSSLTLGAIGFPKRPHATETVIGSTTASAAVSGLPRLKGPSGSKLPLPSLKVKRGP